MSKSFIVVLKDGTQLSISRTFGQSFWEQPGEVAGTVCSVTERKNDSLVGGTIRIPKSSISYIVS